MLPKKINAVFGNRIFVTVMLYITVSVLVFFAVQTFGKACRAVGYDFRCYLYAAKALLNGKTPYTGIEPFEYIYPLFLAFVIIPVLYIPYPLAVLLWFGCNTAAGFYTITILLKEMPVAKDKFLYFSCILAVFWLLLPPIQNDLHNGQVNLIILLLCTLFFRMMQQKNIHSASLCLAAGIALKIYPAIFFQFLLLRKEWKGFFLTIFYAACFCILPVLFLGNSILSIYQDYFQKFVFNQFTDYAQILPYRIELSFYGILTHSFPGWQEMTYIKIICAALGVLLTGLVDYCGGKRQDNWVLPLYLAGILFIQPLSETHHLVLLIPAMTLLTAGLLENNNRDSGIYTGFLIAFILLSNLEKLDKTGPFYFLAAMCLFVLSAWRLMKERKI